MSIKRPLAALSLAAVIVLAGCTADNGADEEAPDSSNSSEGAPAPDAGDQLEPPEAELDDVPDVVAEVNGDEIGRDEFVTAYEGQLQQAFLSQQSTGQEINQDELKLQVANQLVNNRVLARAAEDAGIEATEEDVTAGLEGLAAQNGLDGVDEALAALEEQGVSEEDARKDVALQFQISTYLEQESDIEEPSEEELRAQYDDLVEQIEAQGEESGPESEIPPFEEARDILADEATREQQSAEIDRILDELLKDANVTVHL